MNQELPTRPTPKVKNVLREIENEETAQAAPSWLEDLKSYLPPDLWRKLREKDDHLGLLNNALERIQSLHYLLSTYLPRDLVQEKIANPKAEAGGKMVNGCLLFSDVSGFTALSERLAELGPRGAEYLTEVINKYFEEMVDILSRSNGTLLKYAGDAILAFFPEQKDGEHALWAARAALRMMRAMQKFSSLTNNPLQQPIAITMKIGLSAGRFLAASIGSEKRMEYALIGSVVSQTIQAEGCTKPGQIVANRAAAERLSAAYDMTEVKGKPEFYLLTPGAEEALGEYEITQTQRRRRRASAALWEKTAAEIRSEIALELIQVKALLPYLASELVERIVAHANQRRVRSEYRPTAVMFCNFTGPETLLELWGEGGEKYATRILSEYFSAVNEVINRFGGIVSRIDPYSQGTKLLALFGAPIAHEDDPQRAVSAALEMNKALAELNQNWAEEFSRLLPKGGVKTFIEHRVGITVGDTFAGLVGASTRREYTVMGDEVNLAARLMSAARPGQILISRPIWEATDAYHITRALPSIRVKGKKNLIEIRQVEGPREDTLLNRIQSRSPLIGRNSELERGWKYFQRARAGKGCLLTLTGQAGVGKSRLADALLDRALKEGWQVYAFQCRSYLSGEPFSCWKGILRSLAGITSIDHPLTQKEKLESLAAQFNLPTEQSKALLKVLKLDQVLSANEVTRESGKWNVDEMLAEIKQGKVTRKGGKAAALKKLAEEREDSKILDKKTIGEWRAALSALLAGLSSVKPLALFFEDAQGMDADSQALTETLIRQISNASVLFLAAARAQDDKGWKNGENIELLPFTKEETRSLVAEILTSGLADIIHEQSGGSPLFVEEISRWIKRAHTIDESRLKEILQNSDILQSMVLSRFESLPEGQREVARVASVIGMEFSNLEVRTLMEMDPATFHESLSALKDAGLITLLRSRITEQDYAFSQPIFRDVLYASLPFERRRELHAAAAAYLAQNAARRKSIDKFAGLLEEKTDANLLREAKRLAHHYEMSEQWREAARQILEAAEKFETPEKSETLYRRALSLLEKEEGGENAWLDKARVNLALGNIALNRLDLPAAAASHEAALSALPAGKLNSEVGVNLMARLCLLLPSQGKIEAAENYIKILLAGREGDWRMFAVAAWLEWRGGRSAFAYLDECRSCLAASGPDPNPRGSAWIDDLAGSAAQALEKYQFLNETSLEALAWIQWGNQLLEEKRPGEAAEKYEKAAGLWKDLDPCGLALCRYRQAEASLQARDRKNAYKLLNEALALLEKAPAILQTQPRQAIQQALTRIYNKNYSAWNAPRWQPFDDLARIRFLFPLFSYVEKNYDSERFA